jgi:hypothetical protein
MSALGVRGVVSRSARATPTCSEHPKTTLGSSQAWLFQRTVVLHPRNNPKGNATCESFALFLSLGRAQARHRGSTDE